LRGPKNSIHWMLRSGIPSLGGSGLLDYYNGSHILQVYPEIKEKLLQFKKGWKAPGKQRKFFEEFAKSKKFNPSNAENWVEEACLIITMDHISRS